MCYYNEIHRVIITFELCAAVIKIRENERAYRVNWGNAIVNYMMLSAKTNEEEEE